MARLVPGLVGLRWRGETRGGAWGVIVRGEGVFFFFFSYSGEEGREIL